MQNVHSFHRPSHLRKFVSGVRRQQGRVLIDEDWNEIVDILEERLSNPSRAQIKFKKSFGINKRSHMALVLGASEIEKKHAVSVISRTLGLPFLRVDARQLISQDHVIIENNINTLFDHANDESWILFFDEADALFGKRGEVKDARDRYADMQVSHLLTFFERYKKGICILSVTSHQKVNTKDLRKFRYKLCFS
ncbi:MAG: AAA family ATPase [Mariprofundus sp.]|nr:AAA family ATPase [Mariprofundus sp.]